MTARRLNWIRWLAAVPCALLATVIVQIGAEAVFRYALVESIGLESWTPWAANGMAAALMGAIFVCVVWGIAPRAKFLVSAVALVAVLVWSASLVFQSLQDMKPDWLLAMGLCGALGGLLAFVWVWRFGPPRLR